MAVPRRPSRVHAAVMQGSQIGPVNLCPSSARGALTLLVIRRGEVIRLDRATSPRQVTLPLGRGLVCDRERDLVLLDGGIENLVVEKGSRLGFEKDPGVLLFDHLVVLSG